MTTVSSRSSSSSSRRPWKGAGGQQKQQQQHYGMMILFMIVVVLLLFSSTCLYMHSTIQALDDEDLIQSLPTQNQHQTQHRNEQQQQQQSSSSSSSLQFLAGIPSLLVQFLSDKARTRTTARFSSSSSLDAGIPPSWMIRGGGRPLMTLRQRYYDSDSQQFAFFVKTKQDNDKDDSTSSTSSLSSNIDWEALQHHVDTKLRSTTTTTTPSQPQTVDGANLWYDVYHCPEVPPVGYPAAWNVLQVLDHWKVDDTAVPPQIYNGICIFDWNVPTDRIKIFTYRAAEVPLMVQHHPELLLAAERWSHESYLSSLIGANQPQRNEHSTNNHFMFWRTSASQQQVAIQKKQHILDSDWKPPTEMVALTFPAWYQKAVAINALTDEQQISAEHWYFRLNGAYDVLRRGRGVNEYLCDELPLFLPDRALAASRIVASTSHDTTSTSTNHKSKSSSNTNKQDEEREALLSSQLFMVDVRAEHGLNCRLGMKGAIAEMHFDTTRNWIVLLQGTRRYILAHPSQCTNLELYPLEHPSGRHSTINWSHPPTPNTTNTTDRPFFHAQVNEVVLQAGDALYLPTSWFHFIVSLNTNYQCNARSGVTHESDAFLKECGFDVNGASGAANPRR